jgi:hypothetical protein
MGDSGTATKSAAATIAGVAELGDEALALLQPELDLRSFVERMTAGKLYRDAVQFLAHALPKREAVWWAWVAARRASGNNPPPKIDAALKAVENWISQPSDENRRAARAAGEKAEFRTPAGCVGLAVFLSGGSLAAPGAPEVPPGEFLSAKMVAGAVIVSALCTEPEKGPEKFQSFISQGLEVARRIKLWEPKKG